MIIYIAPFYDHHTMVYYSEEDVVATHRDSYDGESENGQFHGRGKMKFANGDEYIGEWKHGKRCGTGIMQYYEGGTRRKYVGK